MNMLRAAPPHPVTGCVVLAMILVLIALFSHVLRLREDRHSLASPVPSP